MNEIGTIEVALQQLDYLSEARGDRLLLGQDGVPMSMGVILIIGAVVTVGFAYLFAVDNGRLHALMITSLAVLVVLLLLLQFQLGQPFEGISAIEPTAMELVLAEIDSTSGIPGMNSKASAHWHEVRLSTGTSTGNEPAFSWNEEGPERSRSFLVSHFAPGLTVMLFCASAKSPPPGPGEDRRLRSQVSGTIRPRTLPGQSPAACEYSGWVR